MLLNALLDYDQKEALGRTLADLNARLLLEKAAIDDAYRDINRRSKLMSELRFEAACLSYCLGEKYVAVA